ncbi:MAG: ABC transporter substrate-binding protein [Alphaproteobacteria bacterium]|nr:ABC transporter substrate-binding protein [Alphaproteobacteria bacterium]
MRLGIFFSFFALFILPLSSYADQTYYGLAMHGKPKYDQGATHLDYANPDAPKGGAMTMGAIGTFDTLNPYSIKGKAAEGLNLVYDRLMARVWDEPFTMYPLIAERVEIPEDRSAITVHINPKARFHDGSPVTADDVIFSFETLKNEGRPNMRQIYKLVKSVEKRDERTVHFAFGEGYDQETVMIVAMMPVLSKAYWEGRTFDSTTLDIPVLNGPYRIAAVDPGRSITYERVPDYWAKDLLVNAGHFNIDRITYEYYRDDGVAFEAFKSGDIGLRREFDEGKWASAYDFPALKNGDVIAENLAHGRPEKAQGFIFNTRRAPFDDIRVREALSLLFDYDWANKNLFHGQYKRIESYFPNSQLAAPVPLREESDLRVKMRQADELLKQAGWEVENGKRVKDGAPFEFEILLNAPEDEKLALHFKRSLERMGIFPRIRVLDTAAYRGRLNDYDFDMTIYFWRNSLSPGTEQNLYWTCEAANSPARWNFPGICTPEIDALAGSIASAKSREELVDKIHTLDKALIDGHYMIPLFYSGVDHVAYWKPIKRPENTPLYGMVLESWWIDSSQNQKTD